MKYTLIGLLPLILVSNIALSKQAPLSIYLGTNGKSSDGIYHTRFMTDKQRFSSVRLAAKVQSPNFLAQHPKDKVLYAVCKLNKDAGVIGYKIQKNGDLDEFTRATSPQGQACHISVHPSGRFLLTAHYDQGSIVLFPLDKNGDIGKPKIYKHKGASGVVVKRQSSPHPHWTGFSPDGQYALIPDLGLDHILIYKVNEHACSLSQHSIAYVGPGFGPRHMRFSSDGDFIYLLNELQPSVSVFSWDARRGTCSSITSYPVLDENISSLEAINSAAEILVHPQLPYIYTSNRGHDSISVFKCEESPSKLNRIQIQAIRGAFPRHINLSPAGDWLLAAGMHSNTVAAHKVNLDNGQLHFQTRAITNVPAPTCIVYID